MKFTTFLAIKYLKPQKNKIFSYVSTIIAVLGITTGVATLIVTMGVMSGFHREIRNRLLTMYPHIVITGVSDIPEVDILRLKEIDAGSPFVYSQAILKSKDVVYSTVVKGIDFEKEKKVSGIKNIFVKDEVIELKDNEIFLGKELAQNLNLEMYDEVVMILPTQVRTPFGDLPMTEKFFVKGIFKSGIFEYDNNLCYIDYNKAKKIFFDKQTKTFNAVLGFGIKLKNDNDINIVVKKLSTMMGYIYKIMSWEQLNYNLFSALKLERTMMIIIVSLIILVACFVIVTNLMMLGIQKSKDIGILIAIGSTKNEIKKIFFLQGIILNIIGIISGTVLGLVLSFLIKKYQFIKLPKEVYYIDKIPVYISILDLIIILLIAILVGIIASIYPAKKVAQFDPVEIIRYG